MTDLYVLPDLPYDPAALEPHISARIMELHHDKHHAAYVKGANSTLEKLHDMRGKGDFTELAMLERSLAFHVSGHVLHSVFWTNLSPDGGGEPDGSLGAVDSVLQRAGIAGPGTGPARPCDDSHQFDPSNGNRTSGDSGAWTQPWPFGNESGDCARNSWSIIGSDTIGCRLGREG